MSQGRENKALVRRVLGKHFSKDENRVRLFSLFEKMGIHITPVHFYYPVPSLKDLDDKTWETPFSEQPVNFDITEAIDLLKELQSYQHELSGIGDYAADDQTFYWNNDSFNACDASVYYAMIRHFKPKRIVEIGAGFSTLMACKAAQLNDNTRISVIEPYPRSFLENLPGISELRVAKLQDIALDYFDGLENGDFLFIDSTHVSKIGSDVNYEILRILPRLKPGVFIHFHDIYLPYDMPKSWIKGKLFFWNEEYLIQALLQGGNNYRTIMPIHYLSTAVQQELGKVVGCNLPEYDGGSYWIRKNL